MPSSFRLSAIAAVLACGSITLAEWHLNPELAAAQSWYHQYQEASVEFVDVVVVGGGASGANAALHLHDHDLSVLVVEQQAQLGGMVNSYVDSDGENIDYGVATYTNYTGTQAFFSRLGIETKQPSFSTLNSLYVDLTTGQTIDYSAPKTANEFAALGAYYNVTRKYEHLFLPSYANWPAPDDIPEDLLLPFRQFAVKYGLNDTLLLIWAGIGAGLADMLDCPTLYVIQTFPPQTAAVFLGLNVQYIPASGRNQDIYDRIAEILGDGVMLNSTVVASVRLHNDRGVALLVHNHVTDKQHIIFSKRLVLAIEPIQQNMTPFNLDAKEQSVFGKGTWSAVNTGVVSHPSLPSDIIYNLPATAANGNDYAYPEPPFVDYFEYIGDNLFQVIVCGWSNLTTAEAQHLASEAVDKMATAGTIPATNGTELTVHAWSNHGAMDMRTTAANLKQGYIQEQYSLQGYRSTFWSGAAFSSQLSTFLWAYNLEYLVPKVVDSMGRP